MSYKLLGCKLPKPLVEKRRRARFNKSLEELKHLVPEMAHGAIRMDKADILELTVSHLRALQEECVGDGDGGGDPSYRDGFRRCIEETATVILNTPVPEDIKQHFISQLKVLSLGQETYSPLTPEYERSEISKYQKNPAFQMAASHHNHHHNHHGAASAAGSHTSPLSSHHSPGLSPFRPAERQSAFNSVEQRTVIKQELQSPESSSLGQSSLPAKIWRPW
eukprot:sb/3469801/